MRADRPSKRQRRSALDALATGYADGQLTKEQHEERVSSVLGAGTVADLRSALRDLQLPSEHPASALFAPSAGARSRRLLGNLLALLGVGLLVIIGLVTYLQLTDDGPAPQSEPVAMLERPALEGAVDQLEDQVGTTEVLVAQFSAEQVSFSLPAASGSRRYDMWAWDGHELTRYNRGVLDVKRLRTADLENLDIDRLLRNIDRARGMLVTAGPSTVRVTVSGGVWPSSLTVDAAPGSRVPPHVEVTVTREDVDADTATLVTDLGGRRVLQRSPSTYEG